MRRFRSWLDAASFAACLGVLAACGGGGADPAPVVERVAIDQTGALLTQAGESRRLSATAFDAEGRVVDVPLTWSSSTPASVGIDGTGRVTAQTGSGSSQIVAHVGTIGSPPLLVVVTQPAPGALLLNDAQIVAGPIETAPDAPPAFANTYRVSLAGTAAPAIGSLLINTESKAVGGRVVAAQLQGGTVDVTLQLVSLREMFPSLELSEVFDLARAEISIPADILANYDVKRTGNTFDFTPKASAFAPAASRKHALSGVTGTGTLGPFACKTSLTGVGANASLPFALTAPPIFSVTLNTSLDLLVTRANGFERLIVSGEPTIKVDAGIGVTAAFEGKIECEKELFFVRIPVGGPLSLLVGGLIPVGVGIEASGKVTLATLTLKTAAQVGAPFQIGIACPGGTNCDFVKSFGAFTTRFTPTVDLPSIGDLRVEPALSGFGFVKAAIGNPFLRSLRFDAFIAKAGAKFQASFAPKVAQIADTTYKSDYRISLDASAGVGTGLDDVARLLGLSAITAIKLTVSTDLAKSPTGTVTADRANFSIGDNVAFAVRLDPRSVDFFTGLGPYNVKRIDLVRKGGLNPVVVASANAAPGQTDFNFVVTAPDVGTADEFFAFVVTALLPLDVLALEVANPASAPSPPPPVPPIPPNPAIGEFAISPGNTVAAPFQAIAFTSADPVGLWLSSRTGGTGINKNTGVAIAGRAGYFSLITAQTIADDSSRQAYAYIAVPGTTGLIAGFPKIPAGNVNCKAGRRRGFGDDDVAWTQSLQPTADPAVFQITLTRSVSDGGLPQADFSATFDATVTIGIDLSRGGHIFTRGSSGGNDFDGAVLKNTTGSLPMGQCTDATTNLPVLFVPDEWSLDTGSG